VKPITFLSAAILFALGGACSSQPAPAQLEKHCAMTGEVTALDPKDQTATIRHQAICDWMDAMTMEYPVQSKEEFSQLKVGDRITATVNIKGMDYTLSGVHKGASK
jgi:Cu/Ag efflux protein CusF